MVGPTMINTPIAINPERPDNSIPKDSDSEEHTNNETTTEQREETEMELCHHISQIETNAEYKKRTLIDSNDDFHDNYIPFTKQDSADLFHEKQSRVHASISATGLIWHPRIVTIYSAACSNLIEIELLKPEWPSHIQPCQHPRYPGATGHSIRFHGIIQFRVELTDMITRIWFGIISYLPPKVLLGSSFSSRHLKAIDPKAGLVQLANSLPSPILKT